MQRVRPMDSIQGFMHSFKQFERKLDKLQDDVKFHGNTLSELRMMVANLAVAMNADVKLEENKRLTKRNTAIQYDARFHLEEPRMRNKNAIKPLPSKLKTKSFQDQKYGLRATESPFRVKKLSSPLIRKHSRTGRTVKAEGLRKAAIVSRADKKKPKIGK